MVLSRRQFLAVAAQAAPAKRPNLLYIVIDQLSGLAMPHHDSNARMPNCAALAKSGVNFTNAYTAAMTCGPSRACLDTGLYSQTHGIGGGTTRALGSLDSLPRALASAGYVSSHPNGYNLESERAEHEKWLVDLGYEKASSIYGVDRMARYLDLPLKWKCGRTGLAPEHAFDGFCAQRAIRFIESNRDQPFAAFLQLRGPHDPYMTPRPFDTLVDPANLALPPYRRGEFENKPPRQARSFETQGANKMTDTQIRQMLGLYYGMAAYSDRCVGQVLERVTELGLDDNTVVILTADHGDTMGRHRFFSKDFAFYEPAVRIPLALRAPGRRAHVCGDPASGIDVYPTLCDLLSLPKPARVAGQSLVPRWDGSSSDPTRPIFASQGVPGRNRAVMLRTPQYKLTRYDDGGRELYDLARDPDELNNIVDLPRTASLVESLNEQLVEWERRFPISTS